MTIKLQLYIPYVRVQCMGNCECGDEPSASTKCREFID